MGIFRKSLPKRVFTINFDSEYEESLMLMINESPNNYEIETCSIHFPQETLRLVDLSVDSHEAQDGVSYDDYKQPLEIVGESFYQANIKNVADSVGIDTWISGLLMPEPLNPQDHNAVALILIYKGKGEDSYNQALVGYLSKDVAKKTQTKILKQLRIGQVIPVLAILKDSANERFGVSVRAMAMTKKIKFE